MDSSSYPRLIGDVGGTNARFALQTQAGAAPSSIKTYPCADYPGIVDAMRRYLADVQIERLGLAAIGIANPITGDLIRMTNHHWTFSIEAVRQELGLDRFLVINDFAALALSLPVLEPSDLRQVGGGAPQAAAPMGLLGPGTGLGVSGLWPAAGSRPPIPITGEGGHVTLAGCDAEEDAVIGVLRARFGHASAERALSGPGVVNLYEAVCAVQGVPARALTAADITRAGLDGSDAPCVRTLALFFGMLGTVAGNLALTLGAMGGVYIGGGIVPRLGAAIDASNFRARFEGKGRFRNYLSGVPTYVIDAGLPPALRGAAKALEDA